MAKRRGTRRGSRRSGSGIVSRLYSPFGHFFQATGESAGVIGRSAGDIVRKTVGAVGAVGRSYAKHTNQAIRNITARRSSRRQRRGSRRQRRGSRRQ